MNLRFLLVMLAIFLIALAAPLAALAENVGGGP